MGDHCKSICIIDSSGMDNFKRQQLRSQTSNSAVIHNGSFMNEAFPTKLQEFYEDNDVSMDHCISYDVYSSQSQSTEIFTTCNSASDGSSTTLCCNSTSSSNENNSLSVDGPVVGPSIQTNPDDLNEQLQIPVSSIASKNCVHGGEPDCVCSEPSLSTSFDTDTSNIVICSSGKNDENKGDDNWHEQTCYPRVADDHDVGAKLPIKINDEAKLIKSQSEVSVIPLEEGAAIDYSDKSPLSDINGCALDSVTETKMEGATQVVTYYEGVGDDVVIENSCNTGIEYDSNQLNSLAAFLTMPAAANVVSLTGDVSEAALHLVKTTPNGVIELIDGR